MKVLILHDELAPGAPADQLDVFAQIDAISRALKELGHQPLVGSISLDFAAAQTAISTLEPDLVFNLVESIGGRGRLVYLAPALLDALGIPFAGAGTEAMFQTSCKTLAKERLRDAGISTPAWFTLGRSAAGDFASGRYIVKSVWEEASVGLDEDSVVWADSADSLRDQIERRREALGGDGFAETYVDGREFNLAVLAGEEGLQVLPPAEIDFVGYGRDKPRVVGYRAKWDESSYEYHHTPHRFDFTESDRGLLARLSEMAEVCWRLFNLRGWARVDFRVDDKGRPWVLEINANSCLSPDAGFAAALKQAGIGYADAIARIIADVETSSRKEATRNAAPAHAALTHASFEPVLPGTGG